MNGRFSIEGIKASVRNRGDAWLAQERQRLSIWPREGLIAWLSWNDPNGCYDDEDAIAEGFTPIPHDELLDMVMRHVAVNHETPEEMRMLSRRR